MEVAPVSELVTVTSYGRAAGSARVRVFDWLDWLELDARSATYMGGSSNAPSSLLRHPKEVAVAETGLRRLRSEMRGRRLLLSRQASPLSSGALERDLLAAASLGVYDFDDALYLPTASLTGRLFPKERIWRRAVEAADTVIAGNSVLADQASQLNRNTVVIPSCVNPNEYRMKTDFHLSETPRAIWIGSPSTERFLQAISAELLHAHRTHGLRLTIVSAGEAPLGALDAMVDRVGWDIGTFANVLASADFGVMPLPDDPWSRGKCAYKLLQYGASGLPMIGSPVGANREVLSLSEGLAPETESDWVDVLETVINESATARAARGVAGRRAIEAHYSFRAWQGEWCRAMDVE
ncbi:hypothetical protein DCE93_11220 [Agromyces badenianii]|uniref:Glycosyltransferase n=1 Tax=Agromyces badenianii TaxID=2080742 RepID=A0A2S0WXR1_9MICO|nr:hypothetical protein DCE93_11220 [Agromyces badenianii]